MTRPMSNSLSATLCTMHGAGAVVVQVAMDSHPSAPTKRDTKTL